MKVKYEIVEEVGDWDTSYVLWRFEDDKPVEIIGYDGGEPEDNTFVRDWSWVAPALQKAYEQDYDHGVETGLVLGHLNAN